MTKTIKTYASRKVTASENRWEANVQLQQHRSTNLEVSKDEMSFHDQGLDSSDEEEPKARPVHELVQAGKTKRQQNALQYLADGLNSTRQMGHATLMEILTKIQDSEFVAVVRAHGFLSNVFQSVKKQDDAICNTIFIVLCTRLAKDYGILRQLFDCSHSSQGTLMLNCSENEQQNALVDFLLLELSRSFDCDIFETLPKKKYELQLVSWAVI
jgi:hypothetical protein